MPKDQCKDCDIGIAAISLTRLKRRISDAIWDFHEETGLDVGSVAAHPGLKRQDTLNGITSVSDCLYDVAMTIRG